MYSYQGLDDKPVPVVFFSDLVVESCESNDNSNDNVLPMRYLQWDKVDVMLINALGHPCCHLQMCRIV